MPIPSDHSKPIRQSAKEGAYNQIQQWIIDGTLQPGEKLNDNELAKALGVSRTPIRESLQLLEVQGFVKMYPGKATQVTEVEGEEIKDLLPPLAALQVLSAELAISHLTDEIINLLESTNKRFAEAIRSGHYYNALRIDEEFHQIIVDTANNSYIYPWSLLCKHMSEDYSFITLLFLTEKSIQEHTEIIEIMKEGSPEKLAPIMKENWLRTIKEFQLLNKE
ncbi:GntR family transcriptional regulator [Virgibacillus halodenitrificans]|uniref:GntR family transcriptional regulator n=1 Tax=Virgibacillus halodenitrificans TaxID=1482 RepID=UPI000761B6CF